jgi:hypothetical protein
VSQLLWGSGVLQQNPGGREWLDSLLVEFADKLEG